jgi:putative membrane protein
LLNRAGACEYQGTVAERTPEPADADTALNVEMAAERTWLAWWRTALVATAGALGVGRLAPRLLHAAPAPYVVLGCCYALLAGALLLVGLVRYRAIERAVERGETAPLAARTVALFTLGGIVLATVTTVVVLAQS